MQAPRNDMAPPKDDPFTTEELKQYDGSDSSKPILMAIKGAPIDSKAGLGWQYLHSLNIGEQERSSMCRRNRRFMAQGDLWAFSLGKTDRAALVCLV